MTDIKPLLCEQVTVWLTW